MKHERPCCQERRAVIEYHQASDATTLPQSVEKHHLPARKLEGSKPLPVGRLHQYQPLADTNDSLEDLPASPRGLRRRVPDVLRPSGLGQEDERRTETDNEDAVRQFTQSFVYLTKPAEAGYCPQGGRDDQA